jgi:hypothetical protein
MDKIALDRYLTSEPQDDFTPWVEQVFENYSDEFYDEAYEKRDDWENSTLETSWLERLHSRAMYEEYNLEGAKEVYGTMTTELAAKIIERAYRFFKLKNYKFRKQY